MDDGWMDGCTNGKMDGMTDGRRKEGSELIPLTVERWPQESNWYNCVAFKKKKV